MVKPTSDGRETWDALFDELLSDPVAITREIRTRMQEQLPTYRALGIENLDRDLVRSFEGTVRSARAGRDAVSSGELAELAEVGRSQALAGVPIEELLRAWRIGIEVSVSAARGLGSRLGNTDAEMLEFVMSLLAWSDVAMVETARGHRLAELELARQDQEHRATFVRGVLFGGLPPAEIRVQATAYSLDPARQYVAVRGRAGDDQARYKLERALGFHEALKHRRGLSALIDGDLAGFLRDPPSGEIGGVVGVGPPRPLERLAESFSFATRALAAADGFGLSGVHDIASLGLRAAVAADRDVGEALSARYLEPLGTTGFAEELKMSLREYFACGMHVERAAERLFVHQNTLRYRIGRFEELTGASLRDPAAAFEVWWALEHEAMRRPGGDQDL
jgi:hypothetical protein